MATERKLKVGVVCYPYAGTSSGSSLCWDIVPWLLHVQKWCLQDPRVESFHVKDFNETPITLTRNATVVWALKNGIDVLVMVDSDMRPDCELSRDPQAQPFFPTSFDFLYKNWDRGPHSVCAPYCGPPPISNPYVFKWASGYDGLADIGFKLEMYSREEAAMMGGIQECAAQPTGLIMFDTRIFQLTHPHRHGDAGGWFYYEWTDKFASEKASTEDVTATRDLSLAGHTELRREVNFVNWDAWAGHNKVFCVGKPRPLTADVVSERLAEAVRRNHRSGEQLLNVSFGACDGQAKAQVESARCAGGAVEPVFRNDAGAGGHRDGAVRRSAKADADAVRDGECSDGVVACPCQDSAGNPGTATQGACH